MIVALVVIIVVAVGVIVAVNVMDHDQKVTVTIEQNGEGTVEPSVGDHSYDKDSTITIKATPADGYLLYDISVNGESVTVTDGSYELKVTDKTQVTVTFERFASVSSSEPSAEMSVPGPYGKDSNVTVDFTGLVTDDSLMVTNAAVDNYGAKASVFDLVLSKDSNFESASITIVISGDSSKGTIVALDDNSQPTGVSISYDSAKDTTTIGFVTNHLSEFLLYDGHVTTAQGLRNVAQMVNTDMADIAYVILDNDIDLGNVEWVPIGKDSADSVDKPYAFNGTFDGKGYRISNLTISTGNDQVGLFGVIENGTVIDVTLSGVNIVGGSKVGAVAGETYFKTQIVDVNVNACSVVGNHFVGGIVGYMQGTIDQCMVSGTSDSHSVVKAIPAMSGTVYDDGDKVGGIVGYVQNHQTDLAYSVTSNQVRYVDVTAYRDVGGIVGCIVEKDEQYAVKVNGNITYDTTVTADQNVNPYGYVDPNVGKVVGRVSGECVLVDNMYSQTKSVVSVSVDNASDLEEILTNTSDAVNISLTTDISLDTGDSYVKFGGLHTGSMTIDGNGKKLTLGTSYWSDIDMRNPGATLYLKNIEMDNTQTSGTWSLYDITFMCDVNMDSVKFDKSVALDNIGSRTVMRNVSITETGDNYALWMVAGTHAEMDELTIDSNGGGIRVSDDGVSHPGLTEIDIKNSKFETEKEAAIIVGSEGGAYVTWGSDNDISGVKEDSKNAVWVDVDYVAYGTKVTVVGGSKVVEPNDA